MDKIKNNNVFPKIVRIPYIHVEYNHSVCGKFTNNFFVNSSSKISLTLVINHVRELAGRPLFLENVLLPCNMESSQQLEYTDLHLLIIITICFPLKPRETMGMPAVISSQLINPSSRTASLAIAQNQFSAVGRCAKKCLEKQFCGNPWGIDFLWFNAQYHRCPITTKSSQAKNLPNTEKMGDQ